MRDKMIVDNNKLLVEFENNKLMVEFDKMQIDTEDNVEQNDVVMFDGMELY